MYQSLQRQASFADDLVYNHLLARIKDHPLVRMKPILDRVIVQAEPKLRACYSIFQGRPACAPGILLKMLVLEYLYGLSDPGVEQICTHDYLFRWFIGLGITEDVPDETTLVTFRKRLKEEGFHDLLNALTQEAARLGYLAGKLRILDATHVLSDTPKLGMRGLVRQGLNQVLKVIGKKRREVAEELRKKYRRVLNYAKGKEAATRTAVKQAAAEFVREVKDLPEVAGETAQKLLPVIKRVARGNPDHLVSLTDPDARWGHKRKDKVFGGFKVHVSCAPNGLVTNVETLPGNANEGKRIEPLIGPELAQGRVIEEVYADALYDDIANRRYLKDEGIKAFIPARVKRSQIDHFELEGDRVKCGQGKYSIGKIRQEAGDLYYFSTHDCGHCPNRAKCVSAGEVRKKVFLSDCRRLRRTEWKEKYKTRTVVERDFGHAKRWRGLTRARYRGRGQVGIQALLTFITEDLLILARGP